MTNRSKCYEDCVFYCEWDINDCLILHNDVDPNFTYENFPVSSDCKHYRTVDDLKKYLGIKS